MMKIHVQMMFQTPSVLLNSSLFCYYEICLQCFDKIILQYYLFYFHNLSNLPKNFLKSIVFVLIVWLTVGPFPLIFTNKN
ncbi:Uncharacterized protein FWK35_00011323 [Aphis craccivora]|uniref:Uncharacterized protein n=1 Tax=Aphis craccivora TaxID=307492 RepID=A0A6G0Z2K3_APHCR|nr:Uncharacterized protein FWK35_00011323 [Aphis craccivora]